MALALPVIRAEVVAVVNEAPATARVESSGAGSLEERIAAMQQELDLSYEIVQDLLSIAGAVDILVVADDSSSMNAVADASNPTKPTTRWQELRDTLTRLVRMLLVVEHVDGFKLKFLNDPRWLTVDSADALSRAFAGKAHARGGTPLLENLRPIARREVVKRGAVADDRPAIVLVLTDGRPSDGSMYGVKEILASRAKGTFFSFAMCTEEDDVVAAYNKAIDPVHGCDISDDYLSEKKEVEKHGHKLTPDNWLAKIILGGMMPKYDRLDEPKSAKRSAACIIS